jgi:hypothetical protein
VIPLQYYAATLQEKECSFPATNIFLGVIDLQFEVIQPRELGHRAFDDPTVKGMVTAIQDLLTVMQADPIGRDAVIYRFESVIHPEEETKKLYEADHVILIHRDGKLAGYAEINRDINTWLNRDRYEGDILVDPAAYKRDEHGFPLAKQDMKYGRSLDYTYLLLCEDSYERNLSNAALC